MFLAVTLVGEENGNAICLCKGDRQEHISSAMNTIILIVHFPFFKYNRSIPGFIFLYHSPLQLSIFALIYMYFIFEVIILFNSWLCFND